MSDWTWEYVPDAANVIGGLTHAQIDEVESLASRIADAVAVRKIGVPFDVRESVSSVKSYGEGPVVIWFLEDYRDDVVLVVRVHSGCLTRQINRVGQAVAGLDRSRRDDHHLGVEIDRSVFRFPVSAPALWTSSLDPAFRLCRTRIRSPRWSNPAGASFAQPRVDRPGSSMASTSSSPHIVHLPDWHLDEPGVVTTA